MRERSRRVVDGVTRGEPFAIEVDGVPVEAFPGETVAATLIAAGWRGFGRTERTRALRGVYCGIGLCFDCLVTVEGGTRVRACQTAARAGMVVTTRTTLPPEGAMP